MATQLEQSGPSYKVILLGDSGVGKTSLFFRLQTGRFIGEAGATTGIDYTDRVFDVDGTPVKLYVHDTGGGERFRTLTANFFRNAHGVILVYSVEDAFTFDNLVLWVEECRNNLRQEFDNLVWVLVGNKADLPKADNISDDRVLSFCKQINSKYSYETSAKTGENVDALFKTVAKSVHVANVSRRIETTNSPALNLTTSGSRKNEKKQCC